MTPAAHDDIYCQILAKDAKALTTAEVAGMTKNERGAPVRIIRRAGA